LGDVGIEEGRRARIEQGLSRGTSTAVGNSMKGFSRN